MRAGTGVRRALVTGAGGFIGSHLAAELRRRDWAVVALDLDLARVRHLAGGRGFELLEGDVGDGETQRHALRGADTVFHLAAAHLGVSQGDAEFRRVNVEAVQTLVHAAREAGVRRFVHCSSVGVYGHLERMPADEDTPCRPDLVYEETKLAGETVVRDAAREGFPAVILRPAWVYGPGCPRTERLFRTIRKGRFVMAGKGDTLRHCVYVRDMVDAFRLAADAEAALGRVIVVGDEGAVALRRLVDEIAGLVGARPPRSVPLALFRWAARAFEAAYRPLGKEPPLSGRTLKFFTGATSFDISRARELLGFRPGYDLTRGLAETWAVLSDPAPWRVPLPERGPA
ncbi:MAG: NAD-dependent epimerase/dehydratase family protein [Deferrisomatales bacterium]|nr:NAD-dependent epimerase/dehydratase family protein [Deferrisomatales bacterium]